MAAFSTNLTLEDLFTQLGGPDSPVVIDTRTEEDFGATPFDIEGVVWSHQGERCSFDTMVAAFGLDTGPLQRLATIVRGADTGCLELAPEAAGLLAVSLGLSQMHGDDLAQLDAGIAVYDALYRWARDAGAETHNWPAATQDAKEAVNV